MYCSLHDGVVKKTSTPVGYSGASVMPVAMAAQPAYVDTSLQMAAGVSIEQQQAYAAAQAGQQAFAYPQQY